MPADEELIYKIRKYGAEHALLLLVRKYETQVFNLIFRVVSIREVAEEVTQDAFIQSFKQLDRLEEPSKYRPWLLQIAYRKAIDRVRLKKQVGIEIDEYMLSTEHDNQTDPWASLNRAELKKWVEEEMGKLEEVDRALISLYYMEEMNINEVAQTTGLSESNVKVRLMRARQQLRKSLNKRSIGKEELY